MKPPYIRVSDYIGPLTVYTVDGSYVRANIDEEFTNFGQHYRFSFIPLYEFWIDQEAKPGEQPYYVAHMLVEWRLMGDGMSYGEALARADSYERAERKRAGEPAMIANPLPALDSQVVHEKFMNNTTYAVKVWKVNGDLVRSAFDVDFTEGGHDLVYDYVPSREVWIDDDVEPEEIGFILLHELHERNLMSRGMPYDKAHASSSRIEFEARQAPGELPGLLEDEGWE